MMAAIILFTLLSSAIADGMLVLWLIRNALLNPKPVDLSRFVPPSSLSVESVRARLADEPWIDAEPLTRCLAAMRWTMNKVGSIEVNGERLPEQLISSVEAGRGALCGNMATLFSYVLSAVNVENRIMFLARNIFDTGDVHAVVEVRINDRWVALDPTFNLTFHSPTGEMLASQEIKQSLYANGARDIVTRFHGDVAYPARVEAYYASIFIFFNNVFVLERDPLWLGLLPARPGWKLRPLMQSRRVYFQNAKLEGGAHLNFMRRLYLVAIYLLGRILFWLLLFVWYGSQIASSFLASWG